MSVDPGESKSVIGGPNRRELMGGAAAAALAAGPTLAAAQTQHGGTAESQGFWPNGARLAIAFTMVIETGGGDPAPTVKGPDGSKFPDLFEETADQYSTREAIPRMLDLFDRRRIKTTALICGQSAERFPALAKEIADRGHELAAHGKTHSLQFQLSRDQERAFIQGAVDLIKKNAGQTPVGYNCARQERSVNTLSLLQELGFLYHVDDISRDEPFIVPVDAKPFVVVPYTQHLTDFSFFNRGNGTTDQFERELKMEFDELYAEAAGKRRMMAVTLHDSVARPGRVKAMEDFLVYAQAQKGVWITRCDAIARFAKSSPLTIKETKAT
jgi:peptidoglycan/xylan/chitin deacetylase (PgdA/CDA1 family)